eukprot:TRINITY_DN52103_c0_g1_i3.p1 TRINITY_DN52103_c0_g1~~TRINITY_DN52103_c0_g1_i3.p1  ORF type:complete len:116 (+),score=23.80 TRINITY_DN52103_c0_g1_i3:206-553(+)
MIDFRFNGQELMLWIGENSKTVDVITEIENKIRNMGGFFADDSGLSIFFEAGTTQSSLVDPVVELLEVNGVKVNSIHFVKPERKLNKQLSNNIRKTEIEEPEIEETIQTLSLIHI